MAESGKSENSGSKFRLNGHGFFLTYPQCAETKEDLLDFLLKLGADKVVVAREKHESGEPHLHAYLKFEKKKDIRKPTYFDFKGYHGNYQTAKCPAAVIKYVKKDEDFLEFNISIKDYEKGQKMHKSVVGQELITKQKTVEEAVKEHPELIFQYGSLKRNVDQYLLNTTAPWSGFRENLWIVASTGKGKSQWCYRTYPDAYRKSQNKWWDGYTGQETVILEDMDTNVLGHYLKIWGDHYACTGEIKGGTVPLFHKRFIITSQYYISNLWKDDTEMAEAIARRFKTVTVEGDYQNGYTLADLKGYLSY